MATTLKLGLAEVIITANQTFPLLPTPEPNQAVGVRDNGDQYAERTRPGTRLLHKVRFEMIERETEYAAVYAFFRDVVDWHRLQFTYIPPDGIARTVWLEAGSFRPDDYTNDYMRLEFGLVEVI
jgi:hypothetical protein